MEKLDKITEEWESLKDLDNETTAEEKNENSQPSTARKGKRKWLKSKKDKRVCVLTKGNLS